VRHQHAIWSNSARAASGSRSGAASRTLRLVA
jgi:hypothetical protein